MPYLAIFLFLLLQLALGAPAARGAATCLEAEGEAAIAGKDLPSAKAEAINRAKWSAVEQAVGVEVKAQSVVQNMALVDEAISREINGSVQSYKLLDENSGDDLVAVRINACVEPASAKEAVAGLALNNGISVVLLAQDPSGAGGYQESNILSEEIIGRLADQGFQVSDIMAGGNGDQAVEAALKSGKLSSLRSLTYRFLNNVLLVGKVDFSLSSRKGEDAGYGISMPFNKVSARLSYRLVSRNPAGEMVILAAGSEQGKGLAKSVEDATSQSLKDLAEKVAPAIVDKVSAHLKAASKKVTVKVQGVSELADNFAVKEAIQNVAWVTEVEERGLGEFSVSYPENTIYLANSLRQKGNFRIQAFSRGAITVEYLKE